MLAKKKKQLIRDAQELRRQDCRIGCESIRSILFIVDISLMIKKNDWEVDCLWSNTFHPSFGGYICIFLASLPFSAEENVVE